MSLCVCGRAVTVGALCALCLGAVGTPPAATGSAHPGGTEIVRLTPGRRPDRDQPEQPHGPEEEAAQLPSGPEAETIERHALVADHPRYGLLNGYNYLGYCDMCPIGLRDPGALCCGPCPGKAS